MRKPVKDLVIDTNVLRLYDQPKDEAIGELFNWLAREGTLTVSQKLVVEYFGARNVLVAALISRLDSEKRLRRVANSALKAFTADRHFRYQCNFKDRAHAKLVFLSERKRLVSFDAKLVKDINRFRKISGIQPSATKTPSKSFFE